MRPKLIALLRHGIAWGVGCTLTLMVFGGKEALCGKTILATLECSLGMAPDITLLAPGFHALRRLVPK